MNSKLLKSLFLSTLIFSTQAIDLNNLVAVAKPICEEYQSASTDLALSKMIDYGISQSLVGQTLEKLSSISKKARIEIKAQNEKLKDYYSERDTTLELLDKDPDNNVLKARISVLEEKIEENRASKRNVRSKVLQMANDIFSKDKFESKSDAKSETCKKFSNELFINCDEIMDTALKDNTSSLPRSGAKVVSIISNLIPAEYSYNGDIIVFINGIRFEYDLNEDKLVKAELVEFRVNPYYRRAIRFRGDYKAGHFELFVKDDKREIIQSPSDHNGEVRKDKALPIHYSVLANLSLGNEVAIKDVKSNSELLHTLCIGKSSKKHFGETFGDEIKINTALRGDVPVFETDFAELEKRAKSAITK